LWQACQLPDFRKLTPDEHARLVSQIFHHLISEDGVLPEDWLARQIARLDVVDGDVDTLSGRIAQIRTWTYAAHKQGWTRDPAHWQGITRAVEDRLSDALHERLTQRFIDRRTALLMRHLRDEEQLALSVDDSGAVSLGSENVGKLEGFHFVPDPRAEGIHARTLRAAAMKGLEGEIVARARALVATSDDAIHLSEHGQLWWSGAVVGKLTAGTHPLTPTVELIADDLLKGELRDSVQARLADWVGAHIAGVLDPLVPLRNAAEARTLPGGGTLPGPARGLAFQLAEALGAIERQSPALPRDVRGAAQALRPFGVRVGWQSVYLPRLIKPAPAALSALLWAIHARLDRIPPPPQPGLTSFALTKNDAFEVPDGFLAAAFYRRLGARAVRLDILERMETVLADAAKAKKNADEVMTVLVSLLGCSNADALALLNQLGWRRQILPVKDGEPIPLWERTKQARSQKHRHVRQPAKSDSPFARLADLIDVD
jgi:ATP-dependent RNA helicase SUPV3L1/SUV3